MYPPTKLGQVIRHRKASIIIDDAQTYIRCRVQSYGKGIVLRDIVSGAEIKTKQQQVCCAGEFLVAEIDAKVGGFGIVPPELDGAVVSSHYFLFTLDETQIDQRYLSYYVRTPEFQDQVIAKGSTNYAAIRPQHVLDYVIPLPPLHEQRRIVAHIDAIAEQIAAARGLRRGAVEAAKSVLLYTSADLFTTSSTGSLCVPFGEVFSFRNDLIRPSDGASGELIFVGLQHVESHTGRRIGEDYLLAEELKGRKFRFSPGEVVYGYLRPYLNKVWIANCEGFCSVDQYVLRPKSDVVDTFYLAHFMRSRLFLQTAIELTNNLQLPRLRSGLLQAINMPLPILDDQRRIVAYLDSLQAEVERLKRLQADCAAELDALLPSLLDRAFRGEL